MKKKKIITIIGVSVVTSIALGEAFSRYVLSLGNPPLSVSHETIEYMYKPNQNAFRFGNRILINQYGMRSIDFSDTKQDLAERRIMVFGDSVTNGGNLTDHAELATSILQDELSEKSNEAIIVGNISAGSWGPGNWLAYAQQYGFFDADIVVLVLSSHDWADNPSFQPLNPNTHTQRKPLLALTEGITRYLPRYLPSLAPTSETRDSETRDSETKEVTKAQPQDTQKGLGDLRAFMEMAKNEAATVVVFQHLTLDEIQRGELEEGYYAIAEVSQELGIKTTSLQPYFKSTLNDNNNLYRDNIHPNNKGQQVLAQVFKEKIEPMINKE